MNVLKPVVSYTDLHTLCRVLNDIPGDTYSVSRSRSRVTVVIKHGGGGAVDIHFPCYPDLNDPRSPRVVIDPIRIVGDVSKVAEFLAKFQVEIEEPDPPGFVDPWEP